MEKDLFNLQAYAEQNKITLFSSEIILCLVWFVGPDTVTVLIAYRVLFDYTLG